MKNKIFAIVAVGLLAGPMVAQAGVVFSFQQVGADVVLTGSGSYDLTGATDIGSGLQNGFVNPTVGLAVGGDSAGTFFGVSAYQLWASDGAFGTGGYVDGSADEGDVFGLDVVGFNPVVTIPFITVPNGYVSGTALSGSTTFANQTFASLGLTAGTYRYALPNDTVLVRIPGAVPEPGTLALLGLGLAGLGVSRRRKAA